MAGPIAKARHVAHRSRRQGTSSLFRATLSVALVLTFALAVVAARSALTQSSAVGSAPVASQVAVDGLANGACMSFAPTAHGRGKTVFLDPGHGGLDPGVVGVSGGRQVLEKDIALAVSTRLTALLRAAGYTVVMSRITDSSVARLSDADSVSGAMTASAVHRDLLARTACANAANSSVMVSIHFDAFDDPSVGGTETFYDSARPFAPQSKALASALQTALVSELDSGDRGVWTDEAYARRPAGGPDADPVGEQLRAPDPAGSGIEGVGRQPEPDARRARRAAVPHQRQRGAVRGRSRGPAADRGGPQRRPGEVPLEHSLT